MVGYDHEIRYEVFWCILKIWKIKTCGDLGQRWPTPNKWVKDEDEREEKDTIFL